MKQFWSKLQFRDAPAQGVFFALTLWIAGFYLLCSVFFYFWAEGDLNYYYYDVRTLRCEPVRMLIPLLLFLLIPIYFVGLALRFFRVRKLSWKCFAVFAGPPVLVLLMPLVNLLVGLFPAWRNDLACRFCLIPLLFPLCFCEKGRRWAIGAFVGWGGGLFMLLLALSGVFFRNPGIVGWRVWFGVAFLLLLAGYLLSAKLLAVYGEIRFRSLFGNAVLFSWAAVAATYLAFTFLAVSVEQDTERRLNVLAKQSGPLTPEALGRSYYRNCRPDAVYWKRIDEFGQKDRTALPEDQSARHELTPAEIARFRRELKQNETVFAEWEKAFSGTIPLPPRVFQFEKMLDMQCINFRLMSRFEKIELWRLRFALEGGDFIGALAAYERLGNVNRALSREIFMFGAIVWARGEIHRLDALEMLLESGLLTNDELRRTSEALLRTETETLPPMLERMRYSEIVTALDIIPLLDEDEWNKSLLFDGLVPEVYYPSRKALSPFLPQFRWWLALDKAKVYGRIIDCPGEEDKRCWHELRPYYSSWINLIDSSRNDVRALVVRLRAERVLIAAELYKREHGDYPETMADLPIDPFSGKPLRYRKGDCLWKMVLPGRNKDALEDSSNQNGAFKALDSGEGKATKVMVPGVQVWSSDSEYLFDCSHGLIRAILRTDPNRYRLLSSDEEWERTF